MTKISDLQTDQNNANLGTQRGLKLLDQSLRELGAGRSILVDREGRVIAGNKTLEAAADIGIEDVILVPSDGTKLVAVQRTALDLRDDERARRLAYYDNRVAEIDLDWNVEQLLADVEAIPEGLWTDGELAELLAQAGMEPEPPADAEPQFDRAAELQEKWGVKPGDLWRIGEHRLLCGDSTVQADVERVMGNDVVDAVFTDPPYGIGRDPSWLDDVYPHRQALSSRDTLINDDDSLDLSFLWQYPRRMIWGFPYIYDIGATGWIVWDKQPGVEGRGIVTPIEMASTTMRRGFDMVRVMWGGYYRAAGEDKQPHPTQKPLGVITPFIEAWTKPGEIVADFFCGSGPVLVACQNLGRQCRAIEIHPPYVAVCLDRMATAFPGIEIERIE